MKRMEKIYDVAMRLPIVAFTLFFLGRELIGIRGLVATHPYFGGDWPFLGALAARVSIVMFLAALALLHLFRHRPIAKFTAWDPKITAIMGLLLSYLLLLLPRAESDVFWNSLSILLILIGCVLSILAVADLGRALSIMPEARKLVTHGLYRRIRHPLYLAEEIATIGVSLQFRSWWAAAILAVHFYFQIRRMIWEERILAETFPGFADYQRQSFRLLPGLY